MEDLLAEGVGNFPEDADMTQARQEISNVPVTKNKAMLKLPPVERTSQDRGKLPNNSTNNGQRTINQGNRYEYINNVGIKKTINFLMESYDSTFELKGTLEVIKIYK